jgi:hypothetical protein
MTVRPLTTASGSHARIVVLLAIHRELTDAQLVRRYQTLTSRRVDPWPYIAESSLRTRRDELSEWGEVIELDREGRSTSQRRMRRWGLNPVPRAFADFDGLPVEASLGLQRTLEALRLETDDMIVLEALQAFARRVGADL